MKIINQGATSNCKWASFIHALALIGIIDSEKTQEIYDSLPRGGMLQVRNANQYFSDKYKYTLTNIEHTNIDEVLKYRPVLWWINGYSQASIKNPPYTLTFEDRIGSHAFLIVERQGEVYKCLNSWWSDVCDHGYFYLKVSDAIKIMDLHVLTPNNMMEDKIKAFRSKWLGYRYQENDDLKYQCVALCKLWSIFIGRPTWPWGGTAYNGWGKDLPGWIKIENKLWARPKAGDILFWAPTKANKYCGHTSFCTRDGGVMWLTHMEQNAWNGNGDWVGDNAIRERRTTYYNLLWWKRAV